MRRITFVVASILIDLFLAWLAMIWLGVAHSTDERVPTFGYWTTFWLLWTLTTVVSSVMYSRDLSSVMYSRDLREGM